MILLADIGNSRLKWLAWRPGGPGAGTAVVYRGRALDEVLEEAWGTLPRPERVAAVNVAGEAVAAAVRDWCESRWRLRPVFYLAGTAACGVRNRYAEPGRLGADRWAAMIGAYHRYGGPVCVIDCGTAVTLDLVDARGRHQGGLILPGMALMRQSLYRDTRGIPDEGEAGGEWLGHDTRSCVTAGTRHAVAGGLERALRGLDGAVRCVLTGGDAARLASLLDREVILEPDLVLHGLRLLAEEAEERECG